MTQTKSIAAHLAAASASMRSQTRTQQIVTAQEIFAQHRDPNTPVAIVHGAYRDDEQVILTTVEKMLEHPIDMLTTVIIGNTTARNHAEWMITPRGYLGFHSTTHTN